MPLVALVALLTTTPASDLEARFKLAKVAGVRFELGQGEKPKDNLEPPDCKHSGPLCDINWKSAPALITPLSVELGDAQVLLRSKGGQPLIAIAPGRVLIALAQQAELLHWPYYNYLLHASACAAAGRAPPRFAEWPGSPLPNGKGRIYIAAGLITLWLLALLLYRVARNRGRAQPDAATRFFAAANATSTTSAQKQAGWQRAGFARPLSGLMTLVASMLLLIGPYFALQSLIATRVQPFPQADGLWKPTYEALWLAWLTFDLGTQYAFVKYFAEHRVSRPEQALCDVQFYVWWQVFARLAEASLLAAVAIGWLPWTPIAIYAPFVAIYGACYSMGMSGVGKLLCQALQRFDYYNLLDMAEYRLLVFVLPIPAVLFGRAWGLAHPIYGEAFGAAVGLGVGQLATNLVMLALGLGVLRRIGVPIGPLFLAQFDRGIARRQLGFGLKVTLANEPYRLTTFLENGIIVRMLSDFTTWLGIKDLLYGRLIWLFYFSWGYFSSAMPALSEALGAGKRRLAQYYVARYFQFGFLFVAAIFSLLVAVGPTYIHGALGPQWSRAANYLLLAAATGLFLPTAWIADSLQQGAGRPGLNVMVMLVEQVARLGLLLLLIPRMQFAGIWLATLLALAIKAIFAWTINHVRILPLTLPLWTAVGAPLMAGAVNYGAWVMVARLIAPTQWSTVLATFFAAGAGSFVVTFFACGFMGGFDSAALEELDQAARMSALVRPICRFLAGAGRLGARVSPFPVRHLALAAEASIEAQAIDAAAQSRYSVGANR
jgi:O-antigen/teichoic acid export membrane protein